MKGSLFICVGFHWKHEEQDLQLPKFRERLIEAIANDVMEDEQIIGVFYGGSIGNQHTDLYSDIDLRKAGLGG